MESADYEWSESIVQSRQVGAVTGTADSMAAQLDFRIRWEDLNKCLRHLLGYGKVQGAPGSFTLTRKLPAFHPRFPWLRVSRILSLKGLLGKSGSTVSTVPCGANGKYGNWSRAEVSVMFEAPRYPMLEDADVLAEHQRFMTKTYAPSTEQLARKGEAWKFIKAAATAITATYPGDLLVRQPKGTVKWTWHDVPEAWIMLGKLIPSNFIKGVGKVNSTVFPANAEVDQNDGVTRVQFQPGTILLLPPEITPKSQLHPNVVGSSTISPTFFPRTYDISISWIHFDPSTDDDTMVTLGALGTVLIRGHNLVPLPRPSASNYRFYAATRGSVVTPIPADEDLLYQYYDMNTLFSYPRSM